MKNKLLELGLSENITDEILDVWDTHLKTVERYSKPSGEKTLKKNLSKIESLSRTLAEHLQNLSGFERQLLSQYGMPRIRELTQEAFHLSVVCDVAKKKKVKSAFKKSEPFTRQLTIELWQLLERHGIPVKLYRNEYGGVINNTLNSVLRILLNEKPENERCFKLMRKASIFCKLPPSKIPSQKV